MMDPREIISDAEIERVHAFANFGDTSKRSVVDQAILQCASGYSNGYTAEQIIIEHGLAKLGRTTRKAAITAKGRKYLFAAFSEDRKAPLELDADIEHLIETLGTDVEINEEFDGADGEMALEARRLETTARRLVREAGYALPETATGG